MKPQIAMPFCFTGSTRENKKKKLLILSKKLLLLSFIFIASGTFYGQTRAKEKAKTEVKTEAKNSVNTTSNTSKVNDAKQTKAEAEKTKTDAKAKADKANQVANDPKGAVKTGAKNSVNTTVSNNSTVNDAKEAKAKADKASNIVNDPKAAAKKTATDKTTNAKNEAAAKTRDKVTGEYNGKKVYTGPQGGQYYINSNGNKVYIKQ